jgi:vacuolar-type H+-ATPase subunit H
MIEKTLNTIKDAEIDSERRVTRAIRQENERVREFKASCDREWEELRGSLNGMEKQIIDKHLKEADHRAKDIKTQSEEELRKLDRLSSRTGTVVKILIEDILK